MKIITENLRGKADHGWLKSAHSFSFADYYHPEFVHFGLLRVLNDDWIAPSMGFGMHPHHDMEIITIPLSGQVKHEDSMGNKTIIKRGEVQIMSAGTGIRHSEVNPSVHEPLELFQIWVFPKEKNLTPRYEQKMIMENEGFNLIVSPDGSETAVKIHQGAYFSWLVQSKTSEATYQKFRSQNGVYLIVVEGEIEIQGQKLSRRDAATFVANENDLKIMKTSDKAVTLLMEIPLSLS